MAERLIHVCTWRQGTDDVVHLHFGPNNVDALCLKRVDLWATTVVEPYAPNLCAYCKAAARG